MTVINNLPEYAMEENFVVASRCDSELWFYGAYGSRVEAEDAAEYIDGVVVAVDEINACGKPVH